MGIHPYLVTDINSPHLIYTMKDFVQIFTAAAGHLTVVNADSDAVKAQTRARRIQADPRLSANIHSYGGVGRDRAGGHTNAPVSVRAADCATFHKN